MRGKADQLIAHTGQHYDHNMSDVFFAELGIPAPDSVLVYGDTNSRSRATPPAPAAPVRPGGYHVATVHRPDNTDDPRRRRAIVDGIAKVGKPVVLLAHPRLAPAGRREHRADAAGAVDHYPRWR
ncbi:hypothetical protein [Actinophytocola sp.]|uniref:hypothetical protein n=1 Tax=Actinophytocola sp. TaxID=1872138 RepID=UPI0025C2ED2F|nr:hypothetical protein [Actinophytocola sp.]